MRLFYAFPSFSNVFTPLAHLQIGKVSNDNLSVITDWVENCLGSGRWAKAIEGMIEYNLSYHWF